MISFKRFSVITGLASLLFGVLLPLTPGVRDPELIAVIFTLFGAAYGVLLILTTFVFTPGFRRKVWRQNGFTIVRYELPNRGQKEKWVNANGKMGSNPNEQSRDHQRFNGNQPSPGGHRRQIWSDKTGPERVHEEGVGCAAAALRLQGRGAKEDPERNQPPKEQGSVTRKQGWQCSDFPRSDFPLDFPWNQAYGGIVVFHAAKNSVHSYTTCNSL